MLIRQPSKRGNKRTCPSGTDFEIYEPSPFDRKWFSHKFHGPGLRYEVGLSIVTGDIVWVNGGVPCGEWPDLRLARDSYTDMVDPGEKTVADEGYSDDNYFIHHKKIMSRHETVNRRLKQFGVLSQRFRHDRRLHPPCFHAVANMTQLMIAHGEKLYDLDDELINFVC